MTAMTLKVAEEREKKKTRARKARTNDKLHHY